MNRTSIVSFLLLGFAIVAVVGQRPYLFSASDYYDRDESYQAWTSKVLRPVEDLGEIVVKYGQFSSAYNSSTAIILQGFQPDIILNIDGEV